MTAMRKLSFVALLLVACGGAEDGTDAGMDASVRDAGQDSGEVDVDAGTPDGGARDASADAGGDASTAEDSGLDCSVIGCSAPSVCGMCDAPCGCCACGEGEEVSIGGEPYVCSGGCYVPRGTGMSGDTCTSTADCGAGLSCCYPCGIPDCDFICEPSCAPGTPGCADGCLLRP